MQQNQVGDLYCFYGRVIPERADVNIEVKSMELTNGVTIQTLSIKKSLVNILCQNESKSNLDTLKNIIQTTVHTLVDSIGFGLSCGYDVEIISSVNFQTGDTNVFGVQEKIFGDEVNKKIQVGEFHPEVGKIDELAILALTNIQLAIALNDFRESIRNPNFTAFHCYRAIEAIRGFFDEIDNERNWDSMHQALGTQKSDFEQVMNAAKVQRHGKVGPQTWEQRKERMRTTWETILKFVNYLKAQETNTTT